MHDGDLALRAYPMCAVVPCWAWMRGLQPYPLGASSPGWSNRVPRRAQRTPGFYRSRAKSSRGESDTHTANMEPEGEDVVISHANHESHVVYSVRGVRVKSLFRLYFNLHFRAQTAAPGSARRFSFTFFGPRSRPPSPRRPDPHPGPIPAPPGAPGHRHRAPGAQMPKPPNATPIRYTIVSKY